MLREVSFRRRNLQMILMFPGKGQLVKLYAHSARCKEALQQFHSILLFYKHILEYDLSTYSFLSTWQTIAFSAHKNKTVMFPLKYSYNNSPPPRHKIYRAPVLNHCAVFQCDSNANRAASRRRKVDISFHVFLAFKRRNYTVNWQVDKLYKWN